MSGWDWIHAGLEIATFAKAQNAQSRLAEMRTAAEIEEARRVLLEAMRAFVFDISRDIQMVEEQLQTHPQQVYIVSKSLDNRLTNSGLSPDVFPDFQDKEYFFNLQKRTNEIVRQSREKLTTDQIQESDIAIQYIADIPVLQEAITAKTAQESLHETENQWQTLSNKKGNRSMLSFGGGCGAFIAGAFMVGSLLALLIFLGSDNAGAILTSLAVLILSGGFFFASLFLLIKKSGKLPEYDSLKKNREEWKKQLMPDDDWKEVIQKYGEKNSSQLQTLYNERVTFLKPLLGVDFQKYLATGEEGQ